MKEIYHLFSKLLPLMAAIIFGAVFIANAQTCDNITLSIVSTSPASCFNDGVITVKISGASFGNINAATAQLALEAEGTGTPVAFNVWQTVSEDPGNYIIKTYTNVVTGTYTVKVRFICNNSGELIESAAVLEHVNISGSASYPGRAEIMTGRKSMSCQPTGVIEIRIGDGSFPYKCTIESAPAGYTGPTVFTVSDSAHLTLSLDDVPAGTYAISLLDVSCGCTRHYEHTLPAMISDVVESKYILTVHNVLHRSTTANDCKTVVPSSIGSVGLEKSELYYYYNRNKYYEYCYSFVRPSSINYGAQTWISFPSSGPPPYTFPSGTYASHAANRDSLWLYVRPKAQTSDPSIQTACANAVKNQMQDINSLIYATARSGGLASYGDDFGVTTIIYPNCSDISFSLRMDPSIGLCYPVTLTVEDKDNLGVTLQSSPVGGFLSPGYWIGPGSEYLIPNILYQIGKTYKITLTDQERTFTMDWKPTSDGQKFSVAHLSQCGKELPYIRTTPNWETILPGTQFKYIAGPIPALPCGITRGGSPYVVSSGSTSNVFYPQCNPPMSSSDGYNITPGLYEFEITNSCGKVSTIKVPISSFAYYEAPVQYTLEKANCSGAALRVYPATRIYQDLAYANGTVGYHALSTFHTNFQVKSCSDPRVPVSNEAIIWGNDSPNPPYIELPDPSLYNATLPVTYTIAFQSKYITCTMELFNVVYDGNFQKPFLNSSEISAYICGDGPTGHIKVSAVKGVSGYTYTIKDPDTEIPLVEGTEIVKNPITVDFFTPAIFEIFNAKSSYKIEVRDNCNESVTITQNMIKLTTPNLIYVTPAGRAPAYCPGEQVELNAISLGGTHYEWTGPNGFSMSGQHPRFLAPVNGSGWYVVSVTPEFCPNLIKDSIYITVNAAPPLPSLTHTDIIACFGGSNVDLNSKTGATPTLSATLQWYDEAGTSLGANPIVSAPPTGTSVFYYVEQEDQSMYNCPSERVQVTLTGDCSNCTGDPQFDFSTWTIPGTACVGTQVITTPVIQNASTFMVSSPNAIGNLFPTDFPLPVTSQIVYEPSEFDAGKTITIYITAYGDASCPSTTYRWDILVNKCNPTLNLKLFLEGVTTVAGGVPAMKNYLQEPDPIYSPLLATPQLPVNNPYGVGSTSCALINYPTDMGKVVDWIKVEIWGNLNTSTVPATRTLLETQALLLRSDGSVVNTAGNIPTFTKQNIPVRVVVKHRNHLSVMSNEIADFSGTLNYNFSTALTQAIRFNSLDAAPMKEISAGVFGFWAGDVNGNGAIDFNDANKFTIDFNNSGTLNGSYTPADLNLNGTLDYNDSFIFQPNANSSLRSPVSYFNEN